MFELEVEYIALPFVMEAKWSMTFWLPGWKTASFHKRRAPLPEVGITKRLRYIFD